MSRLRSLAVRLLATVRPDRYRRELDRELRSHLTLLSDEYLQRGLSVEDARAAAERDLGGADRIREAHREARSLAWLDDLTRDVRHGMRTLAREPRFAVAAVGTLALGIGALASVASVVEAVALRPVPYPEPLGIVQLEERVVTGIGPPPAGVVTTDTLWEWRQGSHALAAIGAYANRPPVALSIRGKTLQVTAAAVTADLFEVLRVRSLAGRTFTAAEELPAPNVAVIGERLWRSVFGADVAAVGGPILVNGRPHTVVGILPASFRFPSADTDLWTPLALPAPQRNRRQFTWALGRLAPGTPLEAAAAEAAALRPTGELRVTRWHDVLSRPAAPVLRALTLAAVVLLVVVWANVTNLVLARSAVRTRELAMRLSLGATRLRLVRHVAIELGVVAVAGTMLGLALAGVAVAILHGLNQLNLPPLFQMMVRMQTGGSALLPRLEATTISPFVIACALGSGVTVWALVSAIPVAHALIRVPAVPALALGGTSSAATDRTGRALVWLQVTVATATVLCSAELAMSARRLVATDAGFDRDGVLTFQLVLPHERPPAGRADVVGRVLRRVEALPGVLAAGATNIPPLLPAVESIGVVVPPGHSSEDMLADPVRTQTRSVTPGYLMALGARLAEGRWLSPDDAERPERVLLVNHSFARRFFPGASPVGAVLEIRRGDATSSGWRVVGVVENIRLARLDEVTGPVAYLLPEHMGRAFEVTEGPSPGNPVGFMSFAVRAASSAEVASAIPSTVNAAAPGVGIDRVTTMGALVDGATIGPRAYAWIAVLFSLVAGSLTVLGAYAVASYALARRTRELAIRLAVGTIPSRLARGLVGQAFVTAAVAVVTGAVLARGSAAVLNPLIPGLAQPDVGLWALTALVVLAVTCGAVAVAARRISRIDPVLALRVE